MRYSNSSRPESPWRYRVWCPQRGETESDAVYMNHIGCCTASEAAEHWAEHFSRFSGDPFSEIDVMVETMLIRLAPTNEVAREA